MKDKMIVNYYNIDNIDYIIVGEKDYKNKHYVYLVNEENPNDILIRYVKGETLYPLDSKDELIEVLENFTK